MVRIFCLTSIIQIPPIVKHVQESSSSFREEMDHPNTIKPTLGKIKEALNEMHNYDLTEIDIGYDPTFKNESNNRIYYMYIYRKDTDLIVIKMIRGAVEYHTVSDQMFELLISTSKLFPQEIKYDLQIKVRCVKNTQTRGNITVDEEKYYTNYLNKIYEICKNNKDLQETAFEQLSFELPKSSTNKVLRQKLSDLFKLIELLCDPFTGSCAKVPSNGRYNLMVKSYFKQKLTNRLSLEAEKISKIEKFDTLPSSYFEEHCDASTSTSSSSSQQNDKESDKSLPNSDLKKLERKRGRPAEYEGSEEKKYANWRNNWFYQQKQEILKSIKKAENVLIEEENKKLNEQYFELCLEKIELSQSLCRHNLEIFENIKQNTCIKKAICKCEDNKY